MDKSIEYDIGALTQALDEAVRRGDTESADSLSDLLYALSGGTEADAAMPEGFASAIMGSAVTETGGHTMKSKRLKRLITLAAAAVLVIALGVTAVATQLFGLRDFVMKSNEPPSVSDGTPAQPDGEPADAVPTPPTDLIALQGYPDSREYKASQEWNLWCQSYDTDGAVLNEVGNSANEYTKKYPMYLVYSKEMADKLEEIIAKYGLRLHNTITIVGSTAELIEKAGVNNFLTSANSGGRDTVIGGYVYDDGSFHYDGEAILPGGTSIPYQFGNYVKGSFSDTYLNIGSVDEYRQWQYKTASGVPVTLALSGNKGVVIADCGSSFVTINVLAGTGDATSNEEFASDGIITERDLEAFVDLFDFEQLKLSR
jgi:hypothetical protein